MMPSPIRLRRLTACLWAGSIWTVGYLVAPTLFATLADRVLAGTVAASMFRSAAWLSLVCGVLLLVLLVTGVASLEAARRRSLLKIACAMLLCTLVMHFGLQPLMAALREGSSAGVMAAAARTRFGILHGVSSLIYLIQSVLAGWLLWKLE